MDRLKKLCMRCMREIKSDETCPHCGYYSNKEPDLFCIRPGLVLENRYLVGEKLDKNNEGIGYIGYDIKNENVIYIREFMPGKFCVRENGNSKIEVISSYENFFQDYLQKFLCHARSIARLRDISAISPVYDIFKSNNTGYYVSDFVRGKTLKDFVKENGGRISWPISRLLFMPILSAMITLHKANVMHLGICPDNLIVTSDNKMIVCGFSINDVRQANMILNSQLFNGYSAPEQYIIRERITESTDVYGFCACMLFAISGKQPPLAVKRNPESKLLVSKDVLNNMPKCVISTIANGLKVHMGERISSFTELRENLSPIKDLVNDNKVNMVFSKSKNEQKTKIIYWSIVSCMSIMIAFLFLEIFNIGIKTINKSTIQKQENDSLFSGTVSNYENPINSANSQKTSAPDLSGVLLRDAQKAAHISGDYEVLLSKEEFSDVIVEGRIISQIPTAGTNIKKGSVIVVNISKGPRFRKLPEIKGLSLSTASNKVTTAGFIPKKEDVFNAFAPPGLVIGYKDLNVDDEVEYGKEVVILVSSEKKEN